MPGLTSSLNIGLTGLQSSQSALNVIGHNIANVNTPGYSREEAVLSTMPSLQYGSLLYGTGSTISSIQGIRDRFLSMQITQATSKQQGANDRYTGIEAISSLFSDGTSSDLSTQLQALFQGFQDLSARPEDASARTSVVQKAQTFVGTLQDTYQQMTEQQQSADQNVSSLLTQVNTYTQEIAQLNDRVAAEPTPGSDNDARDQRQALVDKLATLVGIQTHEDDKGQMQITLDSGAATLVSGKTSYALSGSADPANHNYQKVSVILAAGVTTDVTSQIKDGSLGAQLDLRDNIIPGYKQKLDELAAGVSGQVNLLHRSGYALDGTTTGLDFFKGAAANGANGLPTTVSAATNYDGMVMSLSVNANIVSNPNLIAAANAAASSGNNGTAKAIANLQNATGTVDTNGDGVGDSGPYSSFYSGFVSTVGSQAQAYNTQGTADENLLTALQNQRDSVSGVDLDEEATNLIAFQRGYQASARFISIIDQLTDQLVNQFGR